MLTAMIRYRDGRTEERSVSQDGNRFFIRKEELPAGIEEVDFLPDYFRAKAGDRGFYLMASVENNGHAGLIRFKERGDESALFRNNDMPLYGANINGRAEMMVVTGMALEYGLYAETKGGEYRLYPRFLLEGDAPYEDLSMLRFEFPDDADYADFARRYRQYQLDRGACTTLRERMKTFPVVGESAAAPMIRVRMAWKPVPSPVLDQTEENEPPIHVAVTFDRMLDILEEFHKDGIKEAEFCLVGWNKSGHDGRFPDLFPVEPLLGGEEGLKKVIAKAREYGYLISCHTNVLDAYTIAKRFDLEADGLRNRDGSLKYVGDWGGGRAYRYCPKVAHEKIVVEDMDDLARLGFRGTHYFDVMSIVTPDPCFSPEHRLNRKQAGEWRGKSLALSREKIGASSSEGSWDFCIGDLDYVLYTVFWRVPKDAPPFWDEVVPFWHIVYHGIILYNTCCDTVNTAIKADRSLSLLNFAWGGRPLAYFHAKFRTTGLNWMGVEDLRCTTDEQLKSGVAAVKREYDAWCEIRDLQFEFMEELTEVAPGLTITRFGNGAKLLVNATAEAAAVSGETLAPYSFKVIGRK